MLRGVDNITSFRHLLFPMEVIERPHYIIKVVNLITHECFYLGCSNLPLEKELNEHYLPNALYLVENDFDPLEYNANQYKIKIYEN